jgi:prephenate dehydrogenase
MCEYLAPYADIIVSSRQRTEGDAGFGAQFAPLHEVLDREVLIPSFPSQFFESFFDEHAQKIRRDAIVIDVCSVKVHPLKILESRLPSTCQIIGTHPMFGPASVTENGGMSGLKCVVSPVRVNERTLLKLESFLTDALDLRVLRYTPEQHDRTMAYVQGLSHYIARLMDSMQIPETELATLAYEDLLAMKRVQAQDSWALFMSIMADNPYAKNVQQELKQAIEELDDKIKASES